MAECWCCGEPVPILVASVAGDKACPECAEQLAALERHAQPCRRVDGYTIAGFADLAGSLPQEYYRGLAPLRGEACIGPTREDEEE